MPVAQGVQVTKDQHSFSHGRCAFPFQVGWKSLSETFIDNILFYDIDIVKYFNIGEYSKIFSLGLWRYVTLIFW